MRQRPDRYTIRAGRNLPDKEFRYLRTVIVTAAVHRGFGSSREALPLTFRHWAGVSPYTSAYALAETCDFDKQSPGPAHCGPRRAPVASTLTRTGTPSPEVTGTFCRVPLGGFSRSPVDALLAYLRRFAVRTLSISLEAFLGGLDLPTCRITAARVRLSP